MINILKPDTSSYDNYLDKGRFLLAWRLTLFFSIIFFVLTSITIYTSAITSFFYGIVLLLSVVTLIVLHKTKKYQFTYWIFSVSASILVILSMNTIPEALHYSDFLWILCIILFAYVGLDKKYALVLVFVNIVGVAYFIFFRLNNHFEVLEPRDNVQLTVALVEIIFALAVMAYLINQHTRFQTLAENELIKVNTQLKEQFELIQSKNEENEVLIKEVHHRVKNNLQIVISLLRIQNEELESTETKKQFNEAINRIMSISLVHQKLYQEKALAQIKVKDYIIDLFNDISQYSRTDDEVKLKIKSDLDRISLKTIIPLGLLCNELFTNSFKHAFDLGKGGEIQIQLSKKGKEEFLFEYSDTGEWRADKKNGFGTELIQVLTDQLEGCYERDKSKYTFSFKNLDN